MTDYTTGYIRIRRVPVHVVNRVKDISVKYDNPARHVLKPHIQNMISRYMEIVSKTTPQKKSEARDLTLTGYSQKTIKDLETIAAHIGVDVSALIKVELFLTLDKYHNQKT